MPASFSPRLSEAAGLLPCLRDHLGCAASARSLPIGLTISLLPIAEDGLFGYELVPNRAAPTYLTLGTDQRGVPVLRRSLYCTKPPSTLRLATVNGRFPSQDELDAWHHIEQQDICFRTWSAAADAVWDELSALFTERLQRPIVIREDVHRDLDAALATARAHLADCDPQIVFCGVPNEAQYGFALRRGRGERGTLVAWPPGRWGLRWESPAGNVQQSWPAVPAAWEAAAGSWAGAGTPADRDGFRFAVPPMVAAGASQHARG